MLIKSIKTEKVTAGSSDLISILDRSITEFSERSILAITSKIVAICEGSVKATDSIDKNKLIAQQSDLYLPPSANRYNISLTITNGLLIPNAGIDESNSTDGYVLWPKDSEKTADNIWHYLRKRFNVKKCGVLITDSKTTPLRWGTTGVALAHSGFEALHDYRQQPDIFGHPMRVTQANLMDGLAAAAVLCMGEGNEQTPLATISDLDSITFQDRTSTKKERELLKIAVEDDLYGSILQAVEWQKGYKKLD